MCLTVKKKFSEIVTTKPSVFFLQLRPSFVIVFLALTSEFVFVFASDFESNTIYCVCCQLKIIYFCMN